MLWSFVDKTASSMVVQLHNHIILWLSLSIFLLL